LGTLKSKKNPKVPLLLAKGKKVGEGEASWLLDILNSVLSPIFTFTYWILNTNQQKILAYLEGTLSRAWMKIFIHQPHGVLESEMPASI
jgi:hypothetical protein